MRVDSHAKPSLLWLQGITCNGNTHSFLNHPELFSILSRFTLVYHPTIETAYTLEEVLALRAPCDILIVEGAYKEEGFRKGSIETARVIRHYADKAEYVITAGTCATFGGVFKLSDPDAISGLAFDGERQTVRYALYRDKLISLPGCPIHPRWLGFVLDMIAQKQTIALDRLHRPKELYGYTVHAGCPRNEYFEWKVDAKGFGFKEGCLFYEQGCQGPYTRGRCNKMPWHDVSSKTRAGTPCFGCTEPSFPREGLYRTPQRMGIPATMPLGVPRRAYLTLTGVAKSFTISRFSTRLLEYE